ncbi:hypothetical protein [Actinomadura sp. DC4]|uniref:hypothetical protein n=1 Tax=Actinomadura sp. DC4 TaxID=3055069 RepID=UPI0025B06785|nr:hypothetical protein [Actinomadura sp. DC4]MDN3359810.1 hypothetical protein [Actinomadura sp. DC4]
MNPCGATTGFFVLGRCGRQSVTVCRCGRALCAEHVDPQGLCPECSGAQGYGDPYRPGWARAFRRSYWRRSSDYYHDSDQYYSYDTYDRGGFDPGDGFDIGGDVGDSGDGGWTDS